MQEYPKMLYKEGSQVKIDHKYFDYYIVNSFQEEKESLLNGWSITPLDALVSSEKKNDSIDKNVVENVPEVEQDIKSEAEAEEESEEEAESEAAEEEEEAKPKRGRRGRPRKQK